jgi:ribosomal protein S12 methylthiotransferase accessory factor
MNSIPNGAIYYRGKPYHAAKQYWYGTHRYCSPEETREKIQPYARRIGLTRVANVTGLDRIGIPVVLSVRPNSGYLAVDAGKGFTETAAIVSAAMEAIERYSAENVSLEDIHLPYAALDARCQVPLDKFPMTKHAIFSPNWPEHWTLGWDLVGQKELAVPTLMASMGFFKARSSERIPFLIGSNGLASGNHLLEAICSGLHEVIERDAVACTRIAWDLGVRQIPRVHLETIESPLVRDLIARFESAQVKLILFDCTVDTQVPTYMAYIYDLVARHIGVYRGYGAHLDPAIAMVRAITEAAQGRLVFIAGSRDDFFRHNYVRLKKGDDDQVIQRLEAIPATVDARERKSQATDTFEGDIHILIEKLKQVGLDQVIAFDLTLPNFDIAIARVLVPGLEGYMFDYYQPGARALKSLRGQ